MLMRIVLSILLLMMTCRLSYANSDCADLRQKRLGKIEFHHVGLGFETGYNKNITISPFFFYGIGSKRNLFNADIGVKYKLCNPLFHQKRNILSASYFNPYLSVVCNFLRFKALSVYSGAELSCNFTMGGRYCSSNSPILIRDINIGNNHITVMGKAGLRFDKWDMKLFYSYNLAPSFNQKYIFESASYDYDTVRDLLFNRTCFGFSVSYLLPF